MSATMRRRVERVIARRVVLDLKHAGFLMNVDNGGDGLELPAPSADVRAVLGAMFAADEDRLYVYRPGAAKPFGWVYFVYGNSGYDVVSDHTTNLATVMEGATKLADAYA